MMSDKITTSTVKNTIRELEHLLQLQQAAFDEQNDRLLVPIALNETVLDHQERVSYAANAMVRISRLVAKTREELMNAIAMTPIVTTDVSRGLVKLDVPFTVLEIRRCHDRLLVPDIKKCFVTSLNGMWKHAWRTHCQQKPFKYVQFGVLMNTAKESVFNAGGEHSWDDAFDRLVTDSNWIGIIDYLTAIYAIFNLPEPTLNFLTTD